MRSYLPDPASAPELFEGLLFRRAIAFGIDMAVIGALVVLISIASLVAGFLTFGLGWLAWLAAVPVAVVAYYGATLGSHRRATLGMQAMDIVLTPTRGQPLDGGMAFLHALLFWVTVWISWPVSLVFALLTPRQQMVHDLIVGALMVRRSPMTRHWAGHRQRSASSA